MTTGKRANVVAGKESEPPRRGENKGDRTNTSSAANGFGKERIRICDKNSSAGDGSACCTSTAPRAIDPQAGPLITRPINRLHRTICHGNTGPASMQTCGIAITKTQPSGNCNWGTKSSRVGTTSLPQHKPPSLDLGGSPAYKYAGPSQARALIADIPLASGNNSRPRPGRGDEPCSTAQPDPVLSRNGKAASPARRTDIPRTTCKRAVNRISVHHCPCSVPKPKGN